MGTVVFNSIPSESNIGQEERMIVYRTLDQPNVIYLVVSRYNTGNTAYELRYSRIDTGTASAWATVTERRGCNHSIYPHEMWVRRGKVYVKGYPLVGHDASLLGSVVLDGTGGTMVTHDWGNLGPTQPVALSSPSGWSASAHTVSVLNSWGYVYTWVQASGQESNHSPLQTNPDSAPSFTGAFSNKRPSMTVTGPADTTEYPFLNIYRTTDGGGTFFFLWQITNTGGSITFEDKFLASGSGNADPIPDADLDTSHVSPTTTSNSPPPAVSPPGITGTTAIQRSTRIVEYSGRLWYAINDYLFYSALEELNSGIPEESWPSGIATPNFFRMNGTINNLVSTPNGLLVMTSKETVRVNGTSKATFNPRPFLGNIGAAAGYQNRAAIEAGENVSWLTEDYKIIVVHGDSYAILTNPLGTALATLGTTTGTNFFDIKFWSQGDKEYLFVLWSNLNAGTSAAQKLYVYDLQKARVTQDDFWNTPWTFSAGPTVLAVGQASALDTENKIIASLYTGDGSSTGTSQIVKFDPKSTNTPTDVNPSGGTTSIGYAFTTSLLGPPAGDHINPLRIPNMTAVLDQVGYERTTFSGDTDPQVYLFSDAVTTGSPTTLVFPANPPSRRAQATGYKTLIQNDVRTSAGAIGRAAVKIGTSSPTAKAAELHTLSFGWLPEEQVATR
jgi:hypothetical protein